MDIFRFSAKEHTCFICVAFKSQYVSIYWWDEVHHFIKETKQSNKPFLRSYLYTLLALFTEALFLFAHVVHEVLWEKEDAADLFILNFLSAHFLNNGLTGLMETVTYSHRLSFFCK